MYIYNGTHYVGPWGAPGGARWGPTRVCTCTCARARAHVHVHVRTRTCKHACSHPGLHWKINSK